nr:phosphatidylserine decarboxylase [uncultured Lichenicoccus sp.]
MSSLIKSLKLVLAPPHPAGRPFLAAGFGAILAGWLLRRASGWSGFRLLSRAGLLFGGFCLYFFRDPERVSPLGDGLVVAPADGRVVSISFTPPPPGLGIGDEPRWRVGIFLSVLDVHVNRMPVAATVTRIAYHEGRSFNASLDKASDENERNAIGLRLADGRTMAVVQIAGLIARRIVCSVREGDTLGTGERFGIIRFGSRTDLYLPPDVVPLVITGQTMIGGETVVAHL